MVDTMSNTESAGSLEKSASSPSKDGADGANLNVATSPVVNADSSNEDTSLDPHARTELPNEVVKASAPSGSTLSRWGTWVYSYAPTVRQASWTTSAVPTVEDDVSETQDAPSLPGPDQKIIEGIVQEFIGTAEESSTKDRIPSKTLAETEPGTQTEQGIGVDPQHRSEVPEGPDQGFESGNTGAWSVSALVSSAWVWGRGRDVMDTDTRATKEQKTETAIVPEESSATVSEPSDNPGESEANATSESVPAPSPPKAVGETQVTSIAPSVPQPGWSGYVGTWLRSSASTPSAEAANTTRIDACNPKSLPASNASDGADSHTEQDEERVDVTALVPRPSDAFEDSTSESTSQAQSLTRNQLSGINSVNEEYLHQHTTDTGRLSRAAWVLTAASRWASRRQPALEPESQVTLANEPGPQNGGLTAGVLTDKPQLKDERASATSNNMKPAEVHRSHHASSFFTAAPSVLMTPELLEARPSPLLPAAATMLSRPNLILPSFNHTFSRPPRGHGALSPDMNSTKEDHSKNPETTLRVPMTRQKSPPSMAWRALGAVSQYARGAQRDGDQCVEPAKPQRIASVETERDALPLLANSGKDRWDGIRRVVIIGVHGWFPNAHVQK